MSANQDQDHLNLLAVFHYVVGGLCLACGSFPLIHLAVGLMLLFAPAGSASGGPPKAFAWFFVVFAGTMVLVGWTVGICIIVAGRRLKERQSYMFCFVMACVECLFMPFGTVLGVFSILVLMRDSVKVIFGQLAPTDAVSPPDAAAGGP